MFLETMDKNLLQWGIIIAGIVLIFILAKIKRRLVFLVPIGYFVYAILIIINAKMSSGVEGLAGVIAAIFFIIAGIIALFIATIVFFLTGRREKIKSKQLEQFKNL